MNGLYIHIPFCNVICSYCDFYKMVAKDNQKVRYVDHLIKELELKKELLKDIKTIYIGGGTPSSLNLDLLEKLFRVLEAYVDIDRIVEYTIEANPNDINDDFCEILNKYKINRVSLGVQSINDKKLKLMNRTHNKQIVKNAFRILRKHKINNINADIIYGVGNENYQTVKKDLLYCIKHGVKHISAYSLILEKKTVLYNLFEKDLFKLMDEDKEAKIYYKIIKLLRRKKFIHYELSNFAKKGYNSVHNQFYWNNCNYIGIGAAASYYIDNIRYTNIKNLELYFSGVNEGKLKYQEVVALNKEEQMKEEFIMGLRLLKGVSITNFINKYKINPIKQFPFINDLIKYKVLNIKNDYIYIPENKLYISNAVLVYFA